MANINVDVASVTTFDLFTSHLTLHYDNYEKYRIVKRGIFVVVVGRCLDFKEPIIMESVLITTNVMSLNPARHEVYLI